MKFLHVFWNYIRFIRKQGSTSWLTLLYPIILILIIGIGLNLGTSNKINVAVSGSDPLIDTLANDNSLNILRSQNAVDLEEMVRSKKAVVGISVWRNESGKHIDIYLDSTKQAVVSNLLLLVDRSINEEKMKTGESLSGIQKKLAPVAVKLKEKRTELASFNSELQNLQQNISIAKNELSQGQTALATYRTELISYRNDLSTLGTYSARLDNYDNRLYSIYNDMYYRESQQTNALNRLSYNINKVDNYLYKINTSLSYITMAKRNVSYGTPAYYYLNDVESELLTLRSDLQTARYDMVDMSNELATIDFRSIRTNITSIRNEIVMTRSDINSFKSNAETRITAMLSDIEVVSTKLTSAISKLDEFDSKVTTLQTKAAELDTLMGTAIGPLDEFLGKKPEDILPPKIVSTSVFRNERWIDMFFPSIVGIDMLLASLLLPMIMKVRMREQGVELRILRSRVSSVSVVLGEILANYTISLLQLFLICFVGIVLFGVRISNPLGFVLVFITLPIVFTSLGVLFSQLVNRSSTAFLLSLLISIPMIFISGTIIPLEFLNPIISTLGTILPLYIVIDFGEKLLFRNVPLIEVFVDCIYIAFFVILNMLISFILYALKR